MNNKNNTSGNGDSGQSSTPPKDSPNTSSGASTDLPSLDQDNAKDNFGEDMPGSTTT